MALQKNKHLCKNVAFVFQNSFSPNRLTISQDFLTQKTYVSEVHISSVKMRKIRQQMVRRETVSFCRFQIVIVYICLSALNTGK